MGSRSFQIHAGLEDTKQTTDRRESRNGPIHTCVQRHPSPQQGKVVVLTTHSAGATGNPHRAVMNLTPHARSDWLGATDPTGKR